MTDVPMDGTHQMLRGIRIAVDSRYLRRPGMGIHNYLVGALRILLAEGAEVALLCNPSDLTSTLSLGGATSVVFGSRRNIIWEQIDLPRYLRRENFDCYWAPGNSGIPWRSIGSTVTVSTTHDLIPLILARMYLLKDPAYAIPYLVWTLAAVLRSDTLLTVSNASAADLRRVFHRTSRVIPPLFAIGSPAGPAGDLPESVAGRSYVIYNGGMDPRKNVANLIEGFAKAHRRDSSIALVVTGTPTKFLVEKIAELGLGDDVVLTGYVSDETMVALLGAATALIYPSLYEGFGLPLLEAFGANLPVVSSHNSALAEVAGDAAIFVDPHDTDSIADGILAVLLPEVADGLRERGRARLLAYDPLRARQALIEVFMHIIDRATDQPTPGRESARGAPAKDAR